MLIHVHVRYDLFYISKDNLHTSYLELKAMLPWYRSATMFWGGNENYADVRCEGIISQFSVVQGSY